MIYIGDAMSKANVLTDASLGKLVSDLRGEHVSVSSYVLGQERNTQLMSALANHTGGVVQAEQPEVDAGTSGRMLAASVNASVVWPNESVGIGQCGGFLSGRDAAGANRSRFDSAWARCNRVAPVNVEMNGTMNGKPVTMKWTAMPERPSDDFGFLPKLVDLAAADKGLVAADGWLGGASRGGLCNARTAPSSLPGWAMRRLPAAILSALQKVAQAALARDPGNPEAWRFKKRRERRSRLEDSRRQASRN